MGSPGELRRAALVALVLVTGGCSFVFVDGPPRRGPRDVLPRCTTAPVAPIVDGALAALAVAGAVVAHQRLGEPDGGAFPNNDFLRMQRTFSILGAIVELAAAGYGVVETTRCRRARRAFSAR